MTTANYSGSDELDFRLIFGEDNQLTSLGHTDVSADNGASSYPHALHEEPLFLHPLGLQGVPAVQPQHSHSSLPNSYAPSASNYNSMDSPSRLFECPSIQITSIPASSQQEPGMHHDGVRIELEGASGRTLSRDQLYLPLDAPYRDTSTLCPSPCSSLSSRSWLSDASSCESFSYIYDDVEAELNEAAARVRLGSPLVSPLASPLPSPLTSPQASPQLSPLVSPLGSPGCATAPALYGDDPWFRYQQQQQLHHRHYARSLSPHQSPYQSPRASVSEESWLSPRPHSSSPRPSSRPSSRPTSPCGKRPHSSAEAVPGSSSPHLSPSPSPSHSPRGSVTDETWLGSLSLMGASFQACQTDADIPSKTRRTYQTYFQDHMSVPPGQGDLGLEEHSLSHQSLDSITEMSQPILKKEDYLSVPQPFSWGKPKQTHTPIFRPTALPSLDCPLPSQYGQCELKLEIQPRPHHRAHYETEGSRGAIKSECGRHPIVKLIGYSEKPVSLQIFIGTADERHVRPHVFYQVHRITGKTVATPSQEILIGSTKILEIPLLPENSMSASIDCAGILKLRNSDIELRKGETDIGRKNTRVRVVFRVHVPHGKEKVLSLQVASVPIECSQRSAQELPQIERFSPTCGSASGGQEMLITGPNIMPESKVIFLEKGPDGRTQWEVDAKTVCEKSKDTSIVVKIPPYHKRMLASPVQVQFYISNGKRKRSQVQRFTYVPVQVKQEFDSSGDAAIFDPADLFSAGAQLPSDQVNPLHQWLFSEGPICVPSSSQQSSYSPLGSSYLNRQHPPDSNLHTVPGLNPIFPSPSLNFSKPSFQQAPQQNLSYNGQPCLPSDSAHLQGGKAPPVLSEHTPSFLNIGHQNSTSNVNPVNQVSPQRYSQGYISPSSSSSQPSLISPDQHMSARDPENLVGFSKSPSTLESPVHHQSLASTPPINSDTFNKDPKSTDPPSLQTVDTSEIGNSAGTSEHHSLDGESVNIKQEPEEEKELTFHSVGLQDITLDDVSEIIVRDLFQSPDSAGDDRGLP